MPDESTLAICICTRHRPDDLRKALLSIAASPQLPDQVIVSDDGVEGKTCENVVAQFSFATYQHGPRLGLGANRNACLASVSTSFICFIDDDVVLPPSFLPLAYQLCEDNRRKSPQPLVSGIEYKHVSASERVRVEPHNADFWGYQRVKPEGELKAMVINAGIFPAALFQKALFDPLLRYGSEEIDIVRHAHSLGYQVEFVPDLWVDHYPSPVNREEYVALVDASRMYATAKAYLSYKRNFGLFLFFSLLAPIKLMLSLARRFGLKGILSAARATKTALDYGMRSKG